MSTVNEDLIRNLYLKYAPNEDVDSKIEYIQNTYGDNQNLFVENFYNKYSPETDLSSKLDHINLKYPSTDVKKKEEIITEDFQIPAELSIESGVEPNSLSLPLTNERFADAAGVVDLSKSLDEAKSSSIIEEKLKKEEDKVSYFENLDVPQLDSAKTSIDQKLIDINRDLYYGRNQGKDFIDAAQTEKKSIEQDRDYATIVKGYKTKDYSMADEMFSAITKLDPNQADYPGLALKAREKYLEYEGGINSDYKEQIKDINFDDYTEVDFNGEERADVDKISDLADTISSSIAEGEDVVRDVVYAKLFERAEQNSDIKSFENKLQEDQGLKDFYERTNTKSFDLFKSTNESYKESESELNQGVSKLNRISAVKQDRAVETYQNSVNIYREQLKSQVAQGTLDAEKASEMLNKFNVESFSALDKIQNNLIKEFDFEVVSLSNIIQNKYGDKMQSDYSDFLKTHSLSEEDKKELSSIYSRLQDDVKKEKYNRLKSEEMRWANLGLITSFGKSFNSTFARQLSGAGTFFNSKILTEMGDEMGTAFSVADEPLEEFSDYLNLPAVVKSVGRLGGSAASSIAIGAAVGSVSGGLGTIPSMALIATAGAMTETIDMAGNMEREVLAETGSKLKAERASEAVMQSQLGNLWTYSLDGLPFVGKALDFIPTKGLRIAAAGLGELPTEITQEVLQSAQEESIRESVDRGGKISAEGFSEKIYDPKFLKPIILEVAPGTVLFGGSARAATEYMTSKKANKIVKEVVNNLNLSSVDKNNEFIKQKIHASILSQGKNFTNTWLSTLQKNGNITEKQLYDFYTFSNNIDGFVRETKGLDLDGDQSNIYFALASKANELYDKAANVNDRVTKSELTERASALKKNAQEFLRDPKAGGTYVVVKNFNNSPLILSEEQALSFVNQYGPILTNKNSGIEMTVVNSDKVSDALKKSEDIQARYIPQENFDRALAILDPIASERRELTLDELTEVGEALGENGSNVLDIGDKVALLEQNAVDLYLDLSERKEEYLKEFETVEETQEDIAVEPEAVEETQEDVAVEPVEEESSGRSLLESRFGKTNMSEFDAAQKALSDISPKTNIVVLKEEEYRKQAKENGARQSTSRGSFDTGKNTIYINADKADATTVAHEVFHAALLNALSMNNDQAIAVTKKLITSLSAKLDNLPTLKKYLNDFASNYNENLQNEEKLAELVGLLAKNYNSMNNESKSLIKRFIDKISEILGLTKDSRLRRELGQFAKSKDNKVVDLLNTIARKTTKGEVITTEDIEILQVQEQGESGQVGTFNGKGRQQKAPNIKDDTRAYSKYTIQKDLSIYKDQNFLTNMYDFTNEGLTDIGGGIVLNLYGGKNYVAGIMEKSGAKLGDVTNIAAFNTKENADAFIKNAIEGNANLFAPHAGTKQGSWQFQQNIFAELVEKLLDNNVITNEELIESFNSGLKSKDGKKGLRIFNKKNETNLTNLNDFKNNPKKLVELLDIDNNYSPDLRKVLNDKIAANKKVQKFLGVKNKTQFAELLEDPMNVGSKPFDLIGVIEFDNTTFEDPSRPKKTDIDYHPSFAWTVKAKIKAIVQPTYFYQSTESTDSYTKFNKGGVVVSRKTDLKDSEGASLKKLYKIALKDTRVYKINEKGTAAIEKGKAPFDGTFEDFQKSKFKSSNVSSSAGSIPKVATFKSDIKKTSTPQTRKQKVNEDIELLYPTTRQQRSFNFTQEQVDEALSSDKKSVEVLSKGLKPKEGDKVGVRLNLNVLKSKKIPIQTVHKGTNSKYKEVNGTSGFFRGEAIDYAPAVTLKNAYFNTDQRGIYKIKNGITNKTPVASVDGEYREVLLDNTSFDGVEIKFNPMVSNLFVNAENDKPIRFVEEATVVGFRVYGRGKIEYFTEENKPKPYTPEDLPQTRKQRTTRLAPNGKRSNLTDVQYDLVRTPAFKKWFGDWENDPKNASKVVDENGEPRVMYHGSVVDFDTFDAKKLGKSTKTSIAKLGFYFSGKKEGADQYVFMSSLSQSGTLTESREFFLDFKNPYVMSKKEWGELINWGSLDTQKYKTLASAKKAGVALKNESISKGHDAIIMGKGDAEVVAFKPNQIKLADGSNRTFDSGSPSIRKQKDTSRETKLKDIAEFSIQEGLSAKETRAYLISIGYSKEEINSGMFDAQKIWNKDGKKIIKWLDWAKRWTLSKRSFKSISMFKSEETMDANIAAELKQAMNNAKELNKAFNAIKDIKERDKTISDANIFLTDEQARETTLWRTMPKNIVELLFTMRNHIDNLSQKLIDSGAINAEESMQTISNNIGVYMNRSFQVFDNKNWKETVSEEVVTAAKNHLKQAYYNSFSGIDKLKKDYIEGKISEEELNKQQSKLLSKQKPVNFIMKDQGVSEAEALSIHVDQVVDQILTGKEVMGYINSSQLGAKDTTILRRKKNIPEPIRALMGEYKDPAYNYAISIMKVANLVERQNFLKNIRDSGMGVYLFEDKPGRKMPEGYKKIALEGSDAMSPLNGLYGPKELVDEFQREAIKLGQFEKAYEGWLKLVGTVKYAKTILSVGTHAKNVIGNLFFMAQNGYVNLSDFNNAFSILKNDFRGKANEKMEALMDEYIRAGIIGQGASIGEIKALFDTQDSFEKSLEKRMDSETQNRLDKIKKGTDKVFKSAQDLYQYEDDMFKIVAYEQEKRDYSKILFNKNYKELTSQEQSSVNNYVAEIVKNILPNYSRIGKLGKAMKAVPVAGTFISFQLEAYRTAGNTLSLISQELKGDAPGLDADAKSRLRRKGAKRLLAFTSFYGFKYALLSTMGLALLPEGDEEDKDKVYPLLPYWNKNADIIITEFKDNGDFEYISFSSSDPYGSLFKTFNATAKYATEGGQVADVLETIYGPFVEQDIFLKTILNIRDNENSYGGKIWEKDDPLGEKIMKASEQVYKTFEPGTVTSIKKIIKTDNSKVDEFIGQMTGFKPHTVNSTRQASYIFKDIYNAAADSKKRYNSLKYKKDELSQEDINKDIKLAQKSVKREYERGVEIYNLLLSLGVPTSKIKKLMSDSNLNKKIQGQIINGKIEDIKYDSIKSKKK